MRHLSESPADVNGTNLSLDQHALRLIPASPLFHPSLGSRTYIHNSAASGRDLDDLFVRLAAPCWLVIRPARERQRSTRKEGDDDAAGQTLLLFTTPLGSHCATTRSVKMHLARYISPIITCSISLPSLYCTCHFSTGGCHVRILRCQGPCRFNLNTQHSSTLSSFIYLPTR